MLNKIPLSLLIPFVAMLFAIPLTLAASKHTPLVQHISSIAKPAATPTPLAIFTPTPMQSGPTPTAEATKPTTKPAQIVPTNTSFPPTPTIIVVNPPLITISYPSENQSITFTNSSQTFCVVDVPSGGNTTGLLRRQNINNQGWSGYAPESTLCFAPNSGSNTFSLQYKNIHGDESSIYARDFTFSLQQNIIVSLHGQLYNDLNCNNAIDAGEAGIPNVLITIMQTDGLVLSSPTTDGSGNYSFSKDITPTASLSILVTPASHAYLFQNQGPITLTASNPSATVNLNHCP